MTGPDLTRIARAVSTGQDTLAGERHSATEANGVLPVSDHALADDGTLRFRPTCRPPGLAITGDIDEYTYCRLLSALKRFTDRPGEIHVNLAGVKYCDLAGLRAIICVTGANDQSHGSRSVVLHKVPPHLKTVLRILGWDSTPGLTMDDREPGVQPRSGRARQARGTRQQHDRRLRQD